MIFSQNFPIFCGRLAALLLVFPLVSCQTKGPGGGGPPTSQGLSEYGDRAGPRGFRTVVLDAGHGGHDSGAISPVTRAYEKHLALAITKKVEAQLRPSFRVVNTRTTDVFLPLDDRVALANRYPGAVLVSIHLNQTYGGVTGPETYWWRTDSYSLARRVQQNLAAVSPIDSGNRGLVRRRLRLTRNTYIPSILVECGYLSSRSEAPLLQQNAYQDKLAKAIAEAIKATAAYGDSGMGPIPSPIYAPPSEPTDPPNS
jgi:N-acetylmuramoyl-L-alanine amidase